jgi:hypothetical protein
MRRTILIELTETEARALQRAISIAMIASGKTRSKTFQILGAQTAGGAAETGAVRRVLDKLTRARVQKRP